MHTRIVRTPRMLSRLRKFIPLFLAARAFAVEPHPAEQIPPAAPHAIAKEAQETTIERMTANLLRFSLAKSQEDFAQQYLLSLALLDQLNKNSIALAPPGPHLQKPKLSPDEPSSKPEIQRTARLPPALSAKLADCCLIMAASPDWRCRLVAADLLAWTEWTHPPHQAIALIKDEFWPVRERAIRSLGCLPPGANLELLAELARNLEDGFWRERAEAAKAIGEINAFTLLLPMLEDPAPEVRLTAAYQFLRKQHQDPAIEKSLRKAFDRETNPKARLELERALERTRPTQKPHSPPSK